MKAFLTVCLTPQDADHTYGRLERSVSKNSFGGFSLWGKIRKSQALPSKEGKGDSTVYVCVCVRAHACVCTKRKQQLLRYLFNSQAAALRRKGSGVDFSPFI